MENSNRIVPPHLNAEVYRTDTTGTSTLSDLDYIRIHDDGNVLIGCSELTGRYWNGSACIFDDIAQAKNLHNEENKNISITSGTADGCFIDSSNKVLLCEDSGAVSIWCRGDKDKQNAWYYWAEEISVAEHDGAALAVDCLDPGIEYVTVGADGNAKVWDIKEMICVRNYRVAHSKPIHDVSVKPSSNTVFATGSLDQYVSLWDQNTEKPISDLVKNDCCIRCLQWAGENKLLYGDEAGILRLIDIRNPKAIFKLAEFPSAVHKLAMHDDYDEVAVCCDNKIVTVCEINEDIKSIIIHSDKKHSSLVRGVAWDVEEKDYLHSVGWDGEVKLHVIERD